MPAIRTSRKHDCQLQSFNSRELKIHERKAMFCPKWDCSRDKIKVPVEKKPNIDRAIK